MEDRPITLRRVTGAMKTILFETGMTIKKAFEKKDFTLRPGEEIRLNGTPVKIHRVEALKPGDQIVIVTDDEQS